MSTSTIPQPTNGTFTASDGPNHQRNRARRRNVAHALAYLGPLRLLADQRNQQEAIPGINTVCLWAAAQAKGYERGEWATYQQWQDKGAQVRKGEKATLVVFWKFANDSSESQEGRNQPFIAVAVHPWVFACSMPPRWTATHPPRILTCPCRNASHTLRRSFRRIGADVRHGGNQAFYAPATDHIQMPPFGAFAENVSYYSTLAHEHTHWTAQRGPL